MTDFAAARTAMVDRQVRPSDVTSFPIIEAMLWAPRERFAPAAHKAVAYADAPLAQAPGREALEPRVFAKMLDGARIGPDDLVLDVAPGLGYSTAVIARMAAAVIAVEPDEDMARQATEILSALEVDNALVKSGEAPVGDAEHGPFDAIFVGGGVGRPPEALLAELASREAFGRAAEVWEVANVMMFLSSDYASYMTGEVVSVSSQHP